MSSLFELACGRGSVGDPDKGFGVGGEMRIVGEVGSGGDGGVGIETRGETGGGNRGTGGDTSVETGVVISVVSSSAMGSV